MLGRPEGKLRAFAKALYTLLLIGTLVYGACYFPDINISNWKRLFGLRGWQIFIDLGTSFCALALIDLINDLLGRLHSKVLAWRLFSVNVNFAPLKWYPALKVPFLILLTFSLPILAFVEEYMFRDGFGTHPTLGWGDAFYRSVLFGLAHLLGGVPLRTGLALIPAGMWFSFYYFRGGLETATFYHFVYNLLAMMLVFGKWYKTGKNPFIG